MIRFSEEAFLRDKVVPPAWYEIEIGPYTKEQTKAGDSNMHVYTDCRVIRDDDNGDESNAGAFVTLRFSDKPRAEGFLLGFAKALGVDAKVGTVFDEEAASGKRVVAYIEPNEYNGRVSNSCNHKYRRMKS